RPLRPSARCALCLAGSANTSRLMTWLMGYATCGRKRGSEAIRLARLRRRRPTHRGDPAMLRRKLLCNLGPLVLILVLTAVAAVWMLQDVLRDLDHIDNQAWRAVERVNQLSIDVNVIEVELYELQLGK